MIRMPIQKSSRLALAVSLLVVGLGAALCYLEPDHTVSWLAGMFVVPVLLGALLVFKPSITRAHPSVRRRLGRAVAGAGLILAASMSLSIANALDLFGTGFSERAMGVVLGITIIVTGNFMPKNLSPLSHERCEPYALQRLAGWLFVIAGLVYAVLWLTLPTDLARVFSMITLGAAVLAVTGVWALRVRGKVRS